MTEEFCSNFIEKINAKDKANQHPLYAFFFRPFVFFFLFSQRIEQKSLICRHRAATTGSVGFIRLLVESSTPSNKLRLNTADRMG